MFLEATRPDFQKIPVGVVGIADAGGPDSPEGRIKLGARIEEVLKADLRRSLVLHWLLSRQGVFAELHFGVRREQDKLQAHAWLEYQGQPIGEREAPTNQYMPLKANETPEAPSQPIF